MNLRPYVLKNHVNRGAELSNDKGDCQTDPGTQIHHEGHFTEDLEESWPISLAKVTALVKSSEMARLQGWMRFTQRY